MSEELVIPQWQYLTYTVSQRPETATHFDKQKRVLNKHNMFGRFQVIIEIKIAVRGKCIRKFQRNWKELWRFN